MSPQRIVLIGVGGASSSGKTTIAKILHSITEGSILLHQDDFYKNDNEIPVDQASGFDNWDSPDALNFDAFIKELSYIKENGDLSPQTKLYENRYNSDTKDQNITGIPKETINTLSSQINHLATEKNLKIAFIDGFLLHHDPNIIQLFDINIFLLASYQTLKDRRFKRNGYQTQESFWVDPPGFFDKIVYSSYRQAHAYLFIDGDVENALRPEKKEELDIVSFRNDEGTSLTTLLESCHSSILERLEKL
jgi:nicotinamide/nicotinate riboside kinase